MDEVAADGIELPFSDAGQDWSAAWHPPPQPPAGTPHGATAVCLVDDQVVLISDDGRRWGLPGGRPEPGERPEDTLRREVEEEACATVTACRLLGFTRGTCLRGPEQGLVLVRWIWCAEVALDPWQPRFEITHRRLVPAAEALHTVIGQPDFPAGLRSLYRRIFTEAGL
jgi:ADP-ribose pyrophosphatase YjhB (NUDIX family)